MGMGYVIWRTRRNHCPLEAWLSAAAVRGLEQPQYGRIRCNPPLAVSTRAAEYTPAFPCLYAHRAKAALEARREFTDRVRHRRVSVGRRAALTSQFKSQGPRLRIAEKCSSFWFWQNSTLRSRRRNVAPYAHLARLTFVFFDGDPHMTGSGMACLTDTIGK